MIGYMIVDNNYCEEINGNIIKYEIGKEYDRKGIDVDINHKLMPPRGIKTIVSFAFHDTLEKLFRYQEYYLDKKILVIEADSVECTYGTFYKANKIKVIREIDDIELIEIINALCFVNSEYSELRRVAAMYGCGLDKLLYDDDSYVRSAVAESNYGLDALVKDDNSIVRASVALIGKKLDILVNDDSDMVRFVVATHGYGLGKLISDASHIVRTAVATEGYGVNRLIKDKNLFVRKAAEDYITYFM